MSTWLITGGAGFIGSHVVDALRARGDRVTVLDDLSTGRRENLPADVELVVGSITDAALVAQLMQRVDGCFHLAAVASVPRSLEDWAGVHEINQTGAIHVFNAAAARKLPVVYASSAAIYGDNPNLPLRESENLRPLTPYGADKAGCELHAAAARNAFGVPTVGLRFFNVYGPRQDPKSPYSGVISIFIERVARGAALTIFGDGRQTRDFIYVADVVSHLLAAMQKMPAAPAVLNVCTGQSVSLLQLADTLQTIAGRKVQIDFASARTGDIRMSLGDPTLAAQSLGLEKRTSLADGLAATYAALT